MNFRERAVYSGIGKLYVGNPDGTHDTVAENIRIYSYNPAAQLSTQNTYKALSRLICKLVHNPDFHNVTVFRGRRIVEDGTITSYTTLPVVGRPEGNVLLFFRDEEISSLLESYDGLTYSQISRDCRDQPGLRLHSVLCTFPQSVQRVSLPEALQL